MVLSRQPPHYCAWLLRCWATTGQPVPGGAGWRFTLEDPHTGERRGFAGLEALLAFLRAELARGCDEPPDGDRSPAGPVARPRAPAERG